MAGVAASVAGVILFAIIPSFIEAIHAALQGLVIIFYIVITLGLLAGMGWIGYKVYKYKEDVEETEEKSK